MENPELDLARQFALYTNRSFFLTGKAGTGKTTLLKEIVQHTAKNCVIAAPTGVAAINAGGVTLHAQFNLPLTAFIPSNDKADLNLFTNRHALASHLHFRREKKKVLQEMELLIIDEVSMVRADLLDAVDFVLRSVRRNNQPFGGVQVLLIGDMHQLPPVVKANEWDTLSRYYAGPYFFNSLVWQEMDAAEIELRQIFRQSDERFLRLLSNIRYQQLNEDDYEELRRRYKPGFMPTESGYILLATHNNQVSRINESELSKLGGRTYAYEAVLTGDFPENCYPCSKTLLLKEGAQVMFTRNDTGGEKYFNGKLAIVKKLDSDGITVSFSDSGEEFKVQREVWENISYTVDEETESVNKSVLGTFSQYPLRLAWAITIHKSQGLTFDKAIIDAGRSFAPGQVYVALSRCRTLEGMVLHSLITPSALHGDDKIAEFDESHHSVRELSNLLVTAKREYAEYRLKQLFDFTKLYENLTEWKETLSVKDIPQKEEALQLLDTAYATLDTCVSVAEKFQAQLLRLLDDFQHNPNSIKALKERCTKAIDYFADTLFHSLVEPVHQHIVALAFKSKVKIYLQIVQSVEKAFWNKLQQLYQARFMDEAIYEGTRKYHHGLLATVNTSATSGKKELGGTFRDTLTLYREGKSAKEIARIRGLAVSTIQGHFSRWIRQGEIDIHEVLPADTIRTLEAFYQGSAQKTLSAATQKFKKKFELAEVKMVLSYLQHKAQGQS